MYLHDYAAEKWPGKKFNHEQLCVLLYGPASDLYKEQLDLIAKPGFDAEFMKQLVSGYSKGLTYEQIKILANPEFSAGFVSDVISKMRVGYSFEKALLEVNYPTPIDERKKNENEHYGFLPIDKQMQFEKDYKSQIQKKIIADKEFKDTFLSKMFDKGDLNPVQKAVLIEGRKNGIPLDVLKTVGRPELNEWQMKELLNSAREGLPLEQIGFLARPEFDPKFIRNVKSRIHQGEIFFDALLEANHPTNKERPFFSEIDSARKREADQVFVAKYFPDMDTLRQCYKIERTLNDLNKKIFDLRFQPGYASPFYRADEGKINKTKEQIVLLEKDLKSEYMVLAKSSGHEVFYENKSLESFFSKLEKLPVERKIPSKISDYGLSEKPRDELSKPEDGFPYKRSLDSMMSSASNRIQISDNDGQRSSPARKKDIYEKSY